MQWEQLLLQDNFRAGTTTTLAVEEQFQVTVLKQEELAVAALVQLAAVQAFLEQQIQAEVVAVQFLQHTQMAMAVQESLLSDTQEAKSADNNLRSTCYHYRSRNIRAN
jgi:hypothetical protein